MSAIGGEVVWAWVGVQVGYKSSQSVMRSDCEGGPQSEVWLCDGCGVAVRCVEVCGVRV